MSLSQASASGGGGGSGAGLGGQAGVIPQPVDFTPLTVCQSVSQSDSQLQQLNLAPLSPLTEAMLQEYRQQVVNWSV